MTTRSASHAAASSSSLVSSGPLVELKCGHVNVTVTTRERQSTPPTIYDKSQLYDDLNPLDSRQDGWVMINHKRFIVIGGGEHFATDTGVYESEVLFGIMHFMISNRHIFSSTPTTFIFPCTLPYFYENGTWESEDIYMRRVFYNSINQRGKMENAGKIWTRKVVMFPLTSYREPALKRKPTLKREPALKRKTESTPEPALKRKIEPTPEPTETPCFDMSIHEMVDKFWEECGFVDPFPSIGELEVPMPEKTTISLESVMTSCDMDGHYCLSIDKLCDELPEIHWSVLFGDCDPDFDYCN